MFSALDPPAPASLATHAGPPVYSIGQAVHLYFTETAGIEWALGGLNRAGVARCLAEETSKGMPFLIDGDGRYVTDVNRWLRSLPTNGAPSPHTWRAYARDVKEWGSYLESHGLTFWEADEEDLDRYHRIRRMGTGCVSRETWLRMTYALDRLYSWAVEEGVIRAKPFDATRIREKGGRSRNIRFVSKRDYAFFRDVGLRGLLPNGSPDPRSRVENVERNAVFADLLVTTGLRLSEGSYIVTTEPPQITTDPAIRKQRWHVPAGLGKGGKERYTLAPVRVLRGLDDYVQFERTVQVRRGWEQGHYSGDGWTVLNALTLHAGRDATTGDLVKIRHADPLVRRRLLHSAHGTLEPLALFLGNDGLPLSHRAWESIFERASERCARFDRDLHITPHVLRHTFATWTLTQYLREHLQQNLSGSDTYKAYLLAPVRRLMRLLGHSSALTTFEYLDLVGDVPELLDEVLEASALDDLPELGEDGDADELDPTEEAAR